MLPDILERTAWFDGSEDSNACPYARYKHTYSTGGMTLTVTEKDPFPLPFCPSNLTWIGQHQNRSSAVTDRRQST
jgi:hypothetical protein